MMRLFSSNEFVSMIEANVFLNSLMTMSRAIVSVTKWSNRSYHVTLLLVPSFMWSHEWPPMGGLHKFYVFLCVFWSFSLKKPHRGIELAKRHPHVKNRRLCSIFGWKSSIGDAGADAGKGRFQWIFEETTITQNLPKKLQIIFEYRFSKTLCITRPEKVGALCECLWVSSQFSLSDVPRVLSLNFLMLVLGMWMSM